MPLMAGMMISEPKRYSKFCIEARGNLPLGSSASKWNGEAVWATASTPLTASSKAPSCKSGEMQKRQGGARRPHLSDVRDYDRFEFSSVGGEELV